MVQIYKRDNRLVEFDKDKIYEAISKAYDDINKDKDVSGEVVEFNDRAKSIADSIEAIAISDNERGITLSVEEVQDMVEERLMGMGYLKLAKAYILYRSERSKERNKEWELTDLQRDIYEQKYRWNNETFDEFLDRVSGGNKTIAEIMRKKRLLPAGRILAGRGTNGDGRSVCYSNCFVQAPPEDNIPSIFETAKKCAETYKKGGGVGLTLKYLRPRGTKVNNTAKASSGAASFSQLYDTTTSLISQGNRAGALLLTLPIDHPDAEEFINMKTNSDAITKANISVGITDDFMEAVKNMDRSFTQSFEVKDTGEVIEKKVDPLKLFRKIAENAHGYAEPGLLFWDNINNNHINDQSEVDFYESVNPCGEKPLVKSNSCLLASLNLSEYIKDPFTDKAKFDRELFKQDLREIVIYMDDLLEEGVEFLPLPENKDTALDYRSLGIGVMGLGEALIKLGKTYGKLDAIIEVDNIFNLMANTCLQQSALLAKHRGTYPLYDKDMVLESNYLKNVANKETRELIEKYGLRNSELLSIAPTGSISTMMNVSGGVEPVFQFEYNRRTVTLNSEETVYKVTAPIVKEYREATGNEGSLPDYFVSTYDIPYRERIDMQSRMQKYIDSAISSTVNLPNEATVEEVEDLYMYAWEQGCKGITIYREGCMREGILTTDKPKDKEEVTVEKKEEVCPICGGEIIHSNGCKMCSDCQWGACSL